MSFTAVPPDARALMAYDAQKRSVGLSYVLWFFGGWIAAHRFYNGRVISGCLLIALHFAGFVLTAVLVGYLVLAGVWLWILVDALLIPGWVRRFNLRLIERLDGGRAVPGFERYRDGRVW